MKIVMYYPKDEKGNTTLQQNAATIHAQAVIQYIDSLPYTKEEKEQMINEVISNIKNN